MANLLLVDLRCLLLTLALLLAPSIATATPAGPPTHRFLLDNGLTVLVREMPDTPVVSFSLRLEIASGREGPADPALAPLVATYLRSAFTRGAWVDDRRQVFAALSADDEKYVASWDGSSLRIGRKVAASQLPLSLFDLSRNIALAPDGVARVAWEQICGTERTLSSELTAALEEAAWRPAAAPTFPVEPDACRGKDLPSPFLRTLLRERIGMGTAVLAVSGGVRAADVEALVRRYFAPLPAGGTRQPAVRWPRALADVQHRTLRAPIPSPQVALGWPTAAFKTRDDAQLDALAVALASRLRARKRRVGDLSSYRVRQASGDEGSTFYVVVEPATGVSTETAVAALDEEIESLRTTGPSADEGFVARDLRLVDLVGSVSAGTASYWLLECEELGNPACRDEYVGAARAVDAAALRDLTARYLPRDRRVVVVVEPDPNAPAEGRLDGARERPALVAPDAEGAASTAPLVLGATIPTDRVWDRPPPPRPAYVEPVVAFTDQRLPSGLWLRMVPRAEEGLVRMTVIAPVGLQMKGTWAESEALGRTLVSSDLGPGRPFRDTLLERGIDFSWPRAETTSVRWTFTFVPERMATAIPHILSSLGQLAVTDDSVKRLSPPKEPTVDGFDLLFDKAFPGSARGSKLFSPGGKVPTRESLQALARAVLAPDNLRVLLSGPVTLEAARAAIESAGFPARPERRKVSAPSPKEPGIWLFPAADAAKDIVYVASFAPPSDDPLDRIAMYPLSDLVPRARGQLPAALEATKSYWRLYPEAAGTLLQGEAPAGQAPQAIRRFLENVEAFPFGQTGLETLRVDIAPSMRLLTADWWADPADRTDWDSWWLLMGMGPEPIRAWYETARTARAQDVADRIHARFQKGKVFVAVRGRDVDLQESAFRALGLGAVHVVPATSEVKP